MGTNALGIYDADELAKIVQEVPQEVRRKQCSLCLWAGAECKIGSLFTPDADKLCVSYTYYN